MSSFSRSVSLHWPGRWQVSSRGGPFSRASIDVTLQLGTLSEVVEVVGQAPLLETSSELLIWVGI